MELRLRPLRVDDESSARAAHCELASDGFAFLLDWRLETPWHAYLQRLDDYRHRVNLPHDRVPATFLVAVVGTELIGRISIRHRLTDYLTNFGGHIGYGVRPEYRRRGFASEMLKQGLIIARAEGIDRVLITCDDTNVASANIIERHGGVLEDVRADPDGPPKRRYWID
jgi:predicted acetyltransferase